MTNEIRQDKTQYIQIRGGFHSRDSRINVLDFLLEALFPCLNRGHIIITIRLYEIPKQGANSVLSKLYEV